MKAITREVLCLLASPDAPWAIRDVVDPPLDRTPNPVFVATDGTAYRVVGQRRTRGWP